MSNHWDLLCRTCDLTCDLDWNHGGDYIQQLIPLLSDMAKMRPVEELLYERFDFDRCFPAGLLEFAERHQGHDLIAIDEYGALHGDCIYRYECSCCGTRLHCRKPRDHEGEHGPLLEDGDSNE